MPSSKTRGMVQSDRNQVAEMCKLLWPDAPLEEHARERDSCLRSGKFGTLPGAILVSYEENGALTGFIEVGLRSHADGCDFAQPVGYVEGWFVHEAYRNQGVGRELMRAAEGWARTQGCVEIASDTWISNDGSQKAHEALGFEVVDRCVHFRKDP